MKHSIALNTVLLILSACASPTFNLESDDKIVAGEVEEAFPAVGWISRDGVRICTGTLIGRRRVLSAAHCFTEGRAAAFVTSIDASRFSFSMGANDESAFRSAVPNVIHVHERALEDSISFDVGVMVLDEPVSGVFFEPSASPVSLGDEGLVIGYGRTSHQDRGGIKRRVNISVTEIESSYWRFVGGPGICKGDSGGPVLQLNASGTAYHIIGVVNGTGPHCENRERRQVFARLDVVTEFLESTKPSEESPAAQPADGSAFVPDSRAGCDNSCQFAFDGVCDDGRDGAAYNVCELGTDCDDCGPIENI